MAADDNKPWCSTRVYDNGTHVSGGGHYGVCGHGCAGRSMLTEKKNNLGCQF